MRSIAFLSRSPIRVAVMATLEDSSKSLRGVTTAVDGPRTTIRDNLKQLVERGLVKETADRMYQLTTTGQFRLRAYRRHQEQTRVVDRLEPFLAHVPFDSLPDSLIEFSDAELAVSTRTDPYRPLTAFSDIVRDAGYLRMFTPTVPSLVLSAVFNSSSNNQRTVKFLAEEGAFERFDRQSQHDLPSSTTVRTVDNSLPFGLAITDRRTAIVCFDDEMIARALVHTDNSVVDSWAGDLFQTHWVETESHPPYPDRMSSSRASSQSIH